MRHSRRHFVQHATASLAGLGLAGLSVPLWAQPLDSTKIVLGFAPGGTIDLVGRRVADKLHPGFARSAVVENKTGAGGQIAVQTVKNAQPDGATILLTPASPVALHLFTYKKLPYDPINDLLPVSGAASFDYGLAVGPMVPATVRTAVDFLAWCRANPALANFGSASTGSAAHFIGSGLGRAGQADLRHVAFRGSQPAILDMIGGQIAAVVGPTGEFMPNVQTGKCRLLATSGPQRGRFTPTTPTLVELGFKDLAYLGWFGFYVPARTAPDLVQRLNAGIVAALGAKDLIDSLATAFMDPWPTSPAQLAATLKTETAFWADLVKGSGFTPEG